MAQLSRPFQIALVAVVLLAAVWLFALQGHSSSTSGSSSASATSPSAPTPSAPSSSSSAAGGSESTAAAEAKSAAAPTHVYHGSAPGVTGLTRAINKAHGAVASSQRNAKRLEEQSARASNESTGASSPSPSSPSATSTSPKPATPITHTGAAASPTSSAASSTSSVAPGSTVKQAPIKAQPGVGRTPARQALVERALNEGKIAVILFWNPKGADDVAVREELLLLEAVHHLIRPVARVPQVRRALERSGLELQKRFAAFQATANEVSSFGSITRDVQVAGTPTILVVNKHGQTIVLTGLQDAFSIEQAIDEARNS